MKKGRLSKEEWDYIEAWADEKDASEIARDLDREIDPIILYLKRIGKTKFKKAEIPVQAEYDIKSKPYWNDLKKQFSADELELLLYHWKQIITQFRKDVLHTEEQQILDTIKMEVLMNRALIEQNETLNQIKGLERELEVEESKPAAVRDKEYYFALQRQIASLRAAKESLGKEYKELQTKKSALLKEIKGTRDQRILKLEGNKQTFSGLISRLLSDPDFFASQGREMELMRLASNGAKKQLYKMHEFCNNEVDRPLLTPESVLNEKL